MLKKFEQFNKDKNIDAICKKYGIKNYNIRKDGKVDINGNFYFGFMGLFNLPLEFGKVKGNFYIVDNNLTSLKGSPDEVGGDFMCGENKLNNLNYSPKIVNGNFYCDRNKITSLESSPEYVGGYFVCNDNNLTNLDGISEYINGDIRCSSNYILDVSALTNIRYNSLDTNDNPIHCLINDIDDLEHFYLINPLNGNVLDKELYDEVREDLNLPKFDYNTLHPDIKLKE